MTQLTSSLSDKSVLDKQAVASPCLEGVDISVKSVEETKASIRNKTQKTLLSLGTLMLAGALSTSCANSQGGPVSETGNNEESSTTPQTMLTESEVTNMEVPTVLKDSTENSNSIEKNNKFPFEVRIIDGKRFIILDGENYSEGDLLRTPPLELSKVIPVPSLEEFKPIFISTYLKSDKYNSGMYARMPDHVKKSRLEKSWTQLNRNLIAGNIKGISNDIENIVPTIVPIILGNSEGLDPKSVEYFTSLFNIQQSQANIASLDKNIASLDKNIAEGRDRIKKLKKIQDNANSIGR